MKILLLTSYFLLPLCAHAQSLDSLVAAALRANPTIAAQQAAIKAAEEQQQQARWAQYPTLQAQAAAAYIPQHLVNTTAILPPSPAPLQLKEVNQLYNAAVTATQPIYTGGKITQARRLATLQTQVETIKQDINRRDIAYEVTKAYWQIVQQQLNRQTLRQAQTQLDSLLHQITLYYKAGITTRNNQLKVQLRLTQLASQQLQVANAITLLTLQLATLTALPADQITVSPAAAATPAVKPLAEPTARPEYQLATLAAEAQAQQARLKQAEQRPTLAFTAAFAHTTLEGTNLIQPQHSNITPLLATLTIPISAWWGQERHAVRRQQYLAQQALADRQHTLDQLTLDNRQAYHTLTEARQQIALADTAAVQATENYRTSLLQYQQGTIAITDLLDAETLQREATNNQAAAIANYNIALADYNRKQ